MNLHHPQPSKRFSGKRYIALVRQSNATQGTTSTEAQLQWMHQEGRRLGMTLADDVVLAGMTGSLPGKRKDIEDLLRRKIERDDFQVIMIQLLDRSTRSGVGHGLWFEHECARHGIEVVYPGENLPDDPDHAVWAKVSKLQAAKEQAKSISQRSTQGWLLALNQVRCLPTSRTPFGCDRLYLNADAEPLFRIRSLADGTQHKLDIQGHKVIERFGAKSRFRKQKDQKPLIVPGEAAAADAVRLMFELHYKQDWGGKRIADRLNAMGILSPTGKGWSQRQVESIYENPIYCGVALGGLTSQGIYHRRGDGIPEPVHLTSVELASLYAPPRTLRPPDEWHWVEQEPMLAFLTRDLRDKALPLIEEVHVERWKRSQDPSRPTRSTNRHRDSEYVLTGLLVDSEHGEKLSGVLCGKAGRKKRKYRHPRGRRGYRKGSIWNAYLPADELEAAVLDIVLNIAADAPAVRQRILDIMSDQHDASDVREQLERLRQERQSLGEKVSRILVNMTDEDREDMRPELDRLRRRRRELDAQIENTSAQAQHAQDNPEAIAESVLLRLQALPSSAEGLDVATKRDLLRAMVERITVDMATKNAEVFLKLPLWAMETPLTANDKGRLAHSSPSPTVDQTHPLLSVPLAFADCRYDYVAGRRSVCYRCRRRAA